MTKTPRDETLPRWTPPTHPGGCGCPTCQAERVRFDEAERILREAGHIR